MKNRFVPVALIFLLLLFSFFMIFYLPAYSSLQYHIDDTVLSLETSKGRENKQQYEYDQVLSEIPVIRQEIQNKEPIASAAEEYIAELKLQRKELRTRKKELEQLINEISSLQEDLSND